MVNAGPDERHGDRGERTSPQAMRMHHVGPPGMDQAAQPRGRPQVTKHARPVRDLHRGEPGLNPEGEVAVGLRRAEHLRCHSPCHAAAREHPDVPSGAAGACAEHERDLHIRITRRSAPTQVPAVGHR